jgi:ATP-dependent protease ClpP protease subunit
MPKEILFYTPIYSFTAEEYITQLEANKSNDISVRMNCPGGDVLATYGMIAKFNEHKNGKKIKVDGMAKSCGFYMCCAADEVECLDVSEFMVHRASYGSWIENDTTRFTDGLKESLNKTNESLRQLIEGKVSAVRFKTVTGVSLDDMFSIDGRLDVNITAEQMRQLGLVQKVTPLTQGKKTEIMALSSTYGVAAFSKEPIIQTENNTTVMTALEFKAANPEAYADVVKEVMQAEKARVATWMVYKDVDLEAVAKGISEGKAVDATIMAEMQLKTVTAKQLGNIEKDNPASVATADEQAKVTAEQKNAKAFEEEVKANLAQLKKTW